MTCSFSKIFSTVFLNTKTPSTMTMMKGHRLFTPQLVLLIACSLTQLTLSFTCCTPAKTGLAVKPFLLSSSKIQQPTLLRMSSSVASSKSSSSTTLPSWSGLQELSRSTGVGKAMTKEMQLREAGLGSAARENTLRKFDSNDEPQVTLFR